MVVGQASVGSNPTVSTESGAVKPYGGGHAPPRRPMGRPYNFAAWSWSSEDGQERRSRSSIGLYNHRRPATPVAMIRTRCATGFTEGGGTTLNSGFGLNHVLVLVV